MNFTPTFLFTTEHPRSMRKMDMEEMLISLMSSASRKVTKTALLSKACSFFWEGFPSSQFIMKEKEIRKAFDKLVASGDLIYVKGKSVTLKNKS